MVEEVRVRRRGRRSVVDRLVLVTTVVGLLTGAIGLAVVRDLERRTQLTSVEDAELAAAVRTANVIDGRIDALRSLLTLLATRDELSTPDAADTVELEVALGVSDELERLVLLDLDGRAVAAVAADQDLLPDDVAPRRDVRQLAEGAQARVDASATPPALELSVPVESPPGTPVGVLVGRTDLTRVAEEVSQRLSTGGRPSLVTDDGTTVADRDRQRVAAGEVRPLADLPPDRPVGRFDGPDGAVIVAAAPLRTIDAAVVVEQPERVVLDAASPAPSGSTVVLLVVVVAIVAAVILAGRRLLRPLGPLADAVGRLGAGESGVRVEERGAGEVADLARGFNTTAARLERRRRELETAERDARMSEERLRLVVEGVQDYAIVLLDVLGDVRTWNAGARRVTGRTEDEVLGRPLTTLLDPDEDVDDPVVAATRTGRGEAEAWFRRPDGSRFRGQLTVTALRRDDGAPYGYAAILHDVTPRQAAKQALEDALEREREAAVELRGANELKDEFLAVAAHEIRTPLSAILGSAELLAVGPHALDEAEAEEVRQVIWTHARDMRDIVERLLDFTSLQAGRVELTPRPLELRTEIDRALAGLGRLLAEHEVVVEVDDAVVELDPALLRHVVTNLASNAAKFSATGTTITVRAAVRAAELRLEVEDEGIGIAAADQRRIFELFRQAEHAEPSARGTGVGLAIVRRYVELAGGEIRVESAPGRGSRFAVEVPLARVD